MKRLRRAFVVLVALGMVVSLSMVIPASAETTTKSQEVLDSEFVLASMDFDGEITDIQVFDWLSLKGDGTFDVRKKKTLPGDSGWQGVHGFAKPKVEGDYIVWEGLKAKDSANVVAGTKLSAAMVDEAKTRIPLDIKFKYRFDGVPITDLNEITGKSGRFELELTLRNTSKERTAVEYKDPVTGEKKKEEVDTYIPMVIQPYDWYFDNRIFFNLEADATGIVFRMPDFYQVGWTIPLFPPATQESCTIWVKADVKNFRMPPLTLAVAFLFPESNQEDPLTLVKPGMQSLFNGVKQLSDGIGSREKENTIINGIVKIDDGLKKIAAGLPEAKSSLDTKLVPGIEQMVAGIGSASTDQTLLYAVNAVQEGLKSMKDGADQMAAGIGDAETADTIINGLTQIAGGLSLFTGMVLGDASQPTTVLGSLASTSGSMKAGGEAYEYVDTNLTDPQKSEVLNFFSQWATTLDAQVATLLGWKGIIDGQIVPGLNDQIIPGLETIKGGLMSISAGIGDAAIEDTLLYAMAAIQNGLAQIKGGLSTGDLNNPGVKEGLILISKGLGDVLSGLGSPETANTLINGTTKLTEGLEKVGEGMGKVGGGLQMFLKSFNLTDAQLAAIAKRGEEFDHLLGRAENAKSDVRFIFQTKPTYNYKEGSSASMVVAIVLSLIIALILVAGGVVLARRGAA